MGAAALSDVLDGWFARRMRARVGRPSGNAEESAGGAFLDPACDKFFMVSAVLAVLWTLHPPLHWVVAILAREVVMAPLLLVYRFAPGPWRSRPSNYSADWPGKATTVAQFIALAAAILQHPGFALTAAVAGAFGLLAVVFYIVRTVRD